MSKDLSAKTFKREVALGILLFLGYVVLTDDVEMVKVLIWPSITFAGACFGFDSYAKQLHGKSSP